MALSILNKNTLKSNHMEHKANLKMILYRHKEEPDTIGYRIDRYPLGTFDDIMSGSIPGTDVSNIVIVKSQDETIRDSKVLYIVDRANIILNSSLSEKIRRCRQARFLIIGEGEYDLNLPVTPNYFGTFEKNNNEITIYYEFSEPLWF